MRKTKFYKYSAKIYGIVITALILVIFVPKLIIENVEKDGSFFK